MNKENIYRERAFVPENNANKARKIILFLLSPILGLLGSIRSLNTRSSVVIIFLFCVTFGAAFSVSNVRELGTIDGISYRIQFEAMSMLSTADFSNIINEYFSFEEGDKDIYFSLVSFLVSRVTSNYHVLFMVLAMVFAFFQLKSLQFLIRSKYYHFSFLTGIILFLFTYNQIFNINGVRFWTAAWIAVYSCLRIFVDKKYQYILLLFLTPLVHGSYYFLLAAFLIAFFFSRFESIWIILFIASFFVSSLSVTLLRDNVSYLPTFMAKLAAPYIEEDYIQSIGHGGTGFYWVQRTFETILPIFINTMVAMLILNRKAISLTTDKGLFGFLLVAITISNFFTAVPSLGGRFVIFCFPIIALLWQNHMWGKIHKVILYILPLVFFMQIYYLLTNYMKVLSLDFLFSPLYIIAKYLFI